MRSEERGDDEGQAGMLLESFRRAAPGPILGSRDEAGPQGLLLDPAARAQQVRGSREAQELRPVNSFRRGHCLSPGGEPTLLVGMRYPVRQPADSGRVGGARDEMPLGGHQAIGNESDRMAAEALAQNRKKPAIVVRREQHVGAARPALHHVKEILRSGWLMGIRHAMTSPDAQERSKPDAASEGPSIGAPRSC